ncbi:hypothetical protein CB0940_11617 [Cercospora beticola]|uniref:Uncharacterized protein n=1 Tax=Cercospora beticola TaxID=122368 RepID=A0A2G5IFG0_CERBT|nr:hypothetical protein CB0940_11617 [Cercospora beticola]PIB03203.1 hypothetical protein CB0940_11617 [Cercospora beticola]WPB03962.1 hypothetical protein RHO25_008606 [Cercospora beticola]
MARTRRARPTDLTESWDDVSDSRHSEGIYDEQTEREEVGSAYETSRNPSQRATNNENESPRRRTLRSSVEPELVMPSAPDARAHHTKDGRKRDATPRFRLNERSNTSDAGQIRKLSRATTPRARMAERSMTSDAGRFQKSKLSQHNEEEYESDEEKTSKTSQYSAVAWSKIIKPLLSYTTDVVGLVLHNMKPIFGWALLVYLLAAALVFGSGFLNNTINNALTPICRLPFTGGLPFCPNSNAPELKGQAEFGQLMQAQNAFEDVLKSSSVGANLPADMKRSEASIRDLKHVVQYSSLPSKNELVFEFSGFVDTARQASGDLSRFNSRIGRAVDHILSTNRWTLSVIDGVSEKEAQRGSIARFFSDNLNIFAPFQPLSLSRDVLLDQYLRHTGAVEEQIMSLIDEAMALRDILDNLDNRLDIISGISTRDGIRIESGKDELFAALWTKLGGNRKDLNKLNSQLELLRNVGEYRRLAWGHVTATLLKLQEIQHSLEDLRERVAMPETVGTDKIPLEIHIESINLGIERLEKQRDASRQLAAQNYEKIVGKAEQGDKKMLGSGKQEREL